jgi:hypothetical protein
LVVVGLVGQEAVAAVVVLARIVLARYLLHQRQNLLLL